MSCSLEWPGNLAAKEHTWHWHLVPGTLHPPTWPLHRLAPCSFKLVRRTFTWHFSPGIWPIEPASGTIHIVPVTFTLHCSPGIRHMVPSIFHQAPCTFIFHLLSGALNLSWHPNPSPGIFYLSFGTLPLSFHPLHIALGILHISPCTLRFHHAPSL